MSRYAKVEKRIWGDAGFRSLSRPPPCGQSLWMHLLTSPRLTAIPGLLVTSEYELAEALKWPLEGFHKAFAELFGMGMAKADWEAGLVWLPNAWKYNRPENPNVVTGWRTPWDEIPECHLKLEAWQALKEFTEQLGGGFNKSFTEWLKKPSEKGLRNGMPNPKPEPYPEQKQEPTEGAGREKQPGLLPDNPPVSTAKRKRVETPLPANFGISPSVQAWADQKGYTLLPQRLEFFIGYSRANDKRYANWDQAFMNSIRDDWAKLNGRNGSAGHARLDPKAPGYVHPSDTWGEVDDPSQIPI